MLYLIFRYLLVIAFLVFGLRICYLNIFQTRKLLTDDIKRKEKQWYFTKTWLGKKDLQASVNLANDELNISIRKFISVIAALFLLLILYGLIEHAIAYEFPAELKKLRQK